MPKPIYGEAGSGILKHSLAILAFTNPSTNSYKRLVPGFEAPVSICYGMSNRSSVIRIPGYASSPDNKRFEFRPSDATGNPYLSFAVLLLAGIDGIINSIDPEKEGYGPIDINVYELQEQEKVRIKSLPKSLGESLEEYLPSNAVPTPLNSNCTTICKRLFIYNLFRLYRLGGRILLKYCTLFLVMTAEAQRPIF